MAEDAARERPDLPLQDALQLVHLYAERGSPKYEKAAMRWLERYLIESTPSMRETPSDGSPTDWSRRPAKARGPQLGPP